MLRRTQGSLISATRMLREQESWRDQGLSYLKYVNICTETLHKCIKESKVAKYNKFSVAGYHAQKPDGQGSTERVVKVPAESKDY